ncbi:MAG: hypothetical protein ACK5M1_04245 [Xanthomarina gelatinilytica]|uniref:hypothetical protein n=1 Tax=Xanthomarina gelatinilytica TaxID=1137281 RepID=UPI003A8B9389
MKKLVAYCIIINFILSCSPQDDGSSDILYEMLPIENATLPGEFLLGNTYEITLTYIRPTTCYGYNNIYYSKEGNERTIAIVAYYNPEYANCETVNEEKEVSFNFKATEGGSYVFKFWQGDSNYLIVEVPVID